METALVFELCGHRLGLDSSRVVSIGQTPALTRMPAVPDCLSGICNFHGNIVPAVDLAKFLGVPHDGPYKCILLVRHLDGEAAILADNVIETVEFGAALQGGGERGAGRYVRGLLADKTAVLDAEMLLDAVFGSGQAEG